MKHKNIKKSINNELDIYDGIAKQLIQMEGLSRIRRYGRGYNNKHILKSDGIFSNYLRTFVYLKFIEDTLKDLKENGV
jgi:hypothetical protein